MQYLGRYSLNNILSQFLNVFDMLNIPNEG